MRTGPACVDVAKAARQWLQSRDTSVAYPVLIRSLMREADHPRILELVLGRMLELVVFSVEGVRERFTRGRAAVH